MALGDVLLKTAFFGERLSMQERIDSIGVLAGRIALQRINSPATLLNATVATVVEPIEALVMGYDPQDYADSTWANAQLLSERVLALSGKFNRAEGLGASTETAIHNLVWYGIAKHNGGRYVRLTTHTEDASGMLGRFNGYDLVHRTDKRRWKIQAKSSGQPDEIINRYASDIIVVSPGILTGDRDASAVDLHIAIAGSDEDFLDSMWHNYIHQLRTQKAPNGVRAVI